jgi:N4-gp56 family major capsid protein
MPNPIDEMVAKALTQTTDLSAIIPVLYQKFIEPNLRKRAILQQDMVINTDLVGTPGDTVKLPILPDITAATVLTEGTAITVDKLNAASTVDLQPVEVGRAIGITRAALDRMLFSGVEEIMDRLSYAMSLYIEPGIAALYDASVPGTANKLTQVYPNGHSSANVATSDLFTADYLVDAGAQLAENDVPTWEDGTYHVFLTPTQYASFRKDAKVRADINFATPGTALRGEIGVWQNFRLFQSTHIKRVTENTDVPVAKAFLTSPRWAAIAYKRMPQATIDPTVYDFGRERRFGITADLDIELVHNARALVLSTSY